MARSRVVTLLFAGLSALCFGAADFSGGFATKRSPVHSVLILSQAVGLLVACIVAPLIGPNQPTTADLLWGALAGLAGALGLAALYQGLASTLMTIVSPIAAVTGAAVPAVFGFLTGERLLPTAGAGIGLALLAIVSLTLGPKKQDGSVGRALLLGLAAGAGFGLFFIAISRPSPSAGLWPLVAARVCSISAVGLFALVTMRPLTLESGSRRIGALAGVLDMAANVFFVLSAQMGLLVLTTVIASLYPAPTVVLSIWLLKERLTVLRAVGLTLAVAGVSLMTI